MKQKTMDAQILDLFMDCLVRGTGMAVVVGLGVTIWEALILRGIK